MARLVEFPLERGGSLLVEIEETLGSGPRPAASEGTVETATIGLEQAISKVKPLAETLLEQLRGLMQQPNTVVVEFGIKLNAQVGAIVAKTGVEGNCKVTLSWKNVE